MPVEVIFHLGRFMKSILVSNLNNLGDVICSTAALDLIRRGFPEARIGFLIRGDAEGVVRGNPLIDDLYVYKYRSGSSLASLWRMARTVREGRYEMFLSLDRKPRSALVAFLAGIKTRITPDRLHIHTNPRWWMPYLSTKVMPMEKDAYRCLVDMFEEPVRRALGLEGRGETSLPPLGQAEIDKARDIFAAAGDRPRIGFSVRANASVKNWSPDRFAALMDKLNDSHRPFIYVTGAPGDREYIDALLSLCRSAKGTNLAGMTSLMDTAALASMSNLFITLDTGAVHVAGNSGIRNLICIFTCTIPEGVLRSARPSRVFWTNESCCPCMSCPYEYDNAPCRTGIGVEEVYAAAVELLEKGE